MVIRVKTICIRKKIKAKLYASAFDKNEIT